MNYQLMEDMAVKPFYYRTLTPREREVISAIRRPQLQEDLYMSMTNTDRLILVRTQHPHTKERFIMRDMD